MPDTQQAPDRHRFPAKPFRPDPDVYAKAMETLKANGWSMNDFLSACLDLVPRNPEAMLKSLGKYKPSTRKGRPPKAKT